MLLFIEIYAWFFQLSRGAAVRSTLQLLDAGTVGLQYNIMDFI